MTIEEVMVELEESDRSDGSENDSSESEDDFDGYLDEDIQSSDDQQCSSDEEQGSDGLSSSEEDQSSEDDMDLDIPSIPPYTPQPGFPAAIDDSSRIAYFPLFEDSPTLGHIVQQTNKLRPFLTPLIANFQAHYTLNQEVSVDESMIGYKGRLGFIQYMPKKPTKWGMKAFVLPDAYNGYMYSWHLYTGMFAE